MIRCKFKVTIVLCSLMMIMFVFLNKIIIVSGSEFPERECCDPIYPSLQNPDPLPSPDAPTTVASLSSIPPGGIITIGKGGKFCFIMKKNMYDKDKY